MYSTVILYQRKGRHARGQWCQPPCPPSAGASTWYVQLGLVLRWLHGVNKLVELLHQVLNHARTDEYGLRRAGQAQFLRTGNSVRPGPGGKFTTAIGAHLDRTRQAAPCLVVAATLQDLFHKDGYKRRRRPNVMTAHNCAAHHVEQPSRGCRNHSLVATQEPDVKWLAPRRGLLSLSLTLQ